MAARAITIEHPLARDTRVQAEELWEFPQGLIGLPGLRRFALVPLEEVPPLELLCSIEEPRFGIALVDPALACPGYELALEREELRPLAERDPAQLRVLVPVVLPGEGEPLRLNLRGPIVLSPRERKGIQRISRDESHAARFVPACTEFGAKLCSS